MAGPSNWQPSAVRRWLSRVRLRLLEELRVLRNAVFARTGRADYERWESPQGLEEWWDERTGRLAKLVPPGSRVIEFGAGRRSLEKMLPPDCSYIPSDLTDRGPGTLVCDLNKRPFPNLGNDAPSVAIFSGVLEYVQDVPSLIDWLIASGVDVFVLSFDPFPTGLGRIGGLRERRRRLYFGYMNNLTVADLKSIFDANGVRCIDELTWTTQQLFRFARKDREELSPGTKVL
jgi:hypothetical protein